MQYPNLCSGRSAKIQGMTKIQILLWPTSFLCGLALWHVRSWSPWWMRVPRDENGLPPVAIHLWCTLHREIRPVRSTVAANLHDKKIPHNVHIFKRMTEVRCIICEQQAERFNQFSFASFIIFLLLSSNHAHRSSRWRNVLSRRTNAREVKSRRIALHPWSSKSQLCRCVSKFAQLQIFILVFIS